MRSPAATHTRWPRLVAAAAAVGVAALVAACGDDGGDDLPEVEGETSPRFEVHAEEMSFNPDAVAVAAGDVEVVLTNDGTILHDLRVEDQAFILEANAGQTVEGRISLDEGSYRYFCSIPGHREAGMEGVLEVR